MSRSFLVLVALIFFAVAGPAQTAGAGPDETELLKELTTLSAGDEAGTSQLLHQNPTLVTARLWEQLTERALQAYYNRQLPLSLWLYQLTLRVAERLTDPQLQVRSGYDIGRTLALLNQWTAAVAAYRASLTAFQAAHRPRDQIYLLSDLSVLYFHLGDYTQARECAEQSLGLVTRWQGSDEPPAAWPDQYGQARALTVLGELAAREGLFEPAHARLAQALELYRQLADENPFYRQYVIETFAALGRVRTSAGDNAGALAYLKLALTLAAQLQDNDLLANLLNSLGWLYLEQEDYPHAREALQQSIMLYSALNNRLETARVLLNLGVVEQRQNNFATALDYFQRCAATAQAVAAQDLLLAAGEGQGAVYTAQGQYDAARDILQRSLTTARDSHNMLRASELLWRLAETNLAASDLPSAESYATEAWRLAQQLRLAKLSYLTASTLGQTYARLDKTSLAIATLQQAVADLEHLRDLVAGTQESAQLFLAHHLTPYYVLIELLLRQGREVEALLYAERAKGRVLLNILRDGKPNLITPLTPAQRSLLQESQAAVTAGNAQLQSEQARPAPDPGALEKLQAALDQARANYDANWSLLYASQSALRLRRGAALPLTPENLSSLPSAQRQALIEFTVTPQHTFAWVITRAGTAGEISVKAYSLTLSAASLEAQVTQLQRRAADRSPLYDESAQELYRLLLKPLAALLAPVTTVCIVPDGSLWNVPFHALRDEGNHYLLEKYGFYYTPSLSILLELQHQAGWPPTVRQELLALANPLTPPVGGDIQPLPEAETEVATLAQAIGAQRTKLLLRAAASEKAFKAVAAAYPRLHLATHGVLDKLHPLRSYLWLAPTPGDPENDGRLTAEEVMDLQLNTDLAVLSACQTANGQYSPGEGIIGLSYALFVAGCRATVVSQWQVKSGSTALLMARFYPPLERGATKSQALRQAALALLKDPRYRHPFYWAGFILIGRDA